MERPNGQISHFKVVDKDGKVLFDGPVGTDEERAKVPADLQPMLKQMMQSMTAGHLPPMPPTSVPVPQN